jgi:hypoxanthine phosphoribosyltransferase
VCGKTGETRLEDLKKRVLFSREAIDKRVREMADEISRDYKGKELIVVGILKGAFIFMADLIRNLSIPCMIDFVRVASYGGGAVSSGKVTVTKDVETSLEGKDVLLIEDIIDTGITLDFLEKKFREKNPRSLRVCALIDKKHRREVEFHADYVGFDLPEGFVVGYGLDFNERARYLADIYVIEE